MSWGTANNFVWHPLNFLNTNIGYCIKDNGVY